MSANALFTISHVNCLKHTAEDLNFGVVQLTLYYLAMYPDSRSKLYLSHEGQELCLGLFFDPS